MYSEIANNQEGQNQVQIDFPMVESKETYTIMWKPQNRWPEGSDPGTGWKPANPPDRYILHLKGNTLVDVSPRPQGSGYPIYQRGYYQRAQTPIIQLKRYESPVTVLW